MPQYMYGDWLPEDDYEEPEEERDPWGCRCPGECIALEPHRHSECCTAEQAAELDEMEMPVARPYAEFDEDDFDFDEDGEPDFSLPPAEPGSEHDDWHHPFVDIDEN